MPHVTGEAHLGIVTGGAIQRRQMTGYTVPTDAADDMVVATALAASAELIVTGDSDLLVMHPFRGIRILKSAEALDHFSGTTGR